MGPNGDIHRVWQELHAVERLELLHALLEQAAAAESQTPSVVLDRVAADVLPGRGLSSAPSSRAAGRRPQFSGRLWQDVAGLDAQVAEITTGLRAEAASATAAARRRRLSLYVRVGTALLATVLTVPAVQIGVRYRSRPDPAIGLLVHSWSSQCRLPHQVPPMRPVLRNSDS